MKVLGSTAACLQVAAQLGYGLDEAPRDGEEYVVVLEGEDALLRYSELREQGVEPVAVVAWCVPSAALVSLANMGAPPVIVGCPDIWRLQSALSTGGDIAHLEKLARLEARFAEPARGVAA